MWSFWVAAAFAVIGALAPPAFSIGAHTRLLGVVIPFGIAAVAFAVNALIYQQGRPVAVALYFVSGLAVVYGILAMLAVPIRLAVVGTCPVGSASCPVGYEQPLTSGESDGLTAATFCGVLAVFIGFYGLLVLYRRRTGAARQQAAAWPVQPPTKTPEPAPVEAVTPAPAVATAQSMEPDELKELPAPDEPKELPAPDEPKELPPPA